MGTWYERKRALKDDPEFARPSRRKGSGGGAAGQRSKRRRRPTDAADAAKDEAYRTTVQCPFELSYDGKRDPYNGYDSRQYQQVIEQYRKIDDQKRRNKAAALLAKSADGAAAAAAAAAEGAPTPAGESETNAAADSESSSSEDEADEDKYAEDAPQAGQKIDTKRRITVRNLRIREDIPKYLRNLDPTSAFYDPKTYVERDCCSPAAVYCDTLRLTRRGAGGRCARTQWRTRGRRPRSWTMRETTLCATRAPRASMRARSCLHGMLLRAGAMCTWKQTPPRRR